MSCSAGRHDVCRARIECTQCGFTEGRTVLAHQWSDAVYFFDDYQRKKAYTCMICHRRIVRDGDSVLGPMPDSHDYAQPVG